MTQVGDDSLRVCALLHHPREYGAHSGMWPLIKTLEIPYVLYELTWQQLQSHSWTLGHWVRSWGNRHYGSTWNALLPLVDELWISAQTRRTRPQVVHFMWGEFASPRHPHWFGGQSARLVATFHCSARRQSSVLRDFRCLQAFDRISVVSRTQIPFFIASGYPEDRILVTRHGVDTDFFRPPDVRPPRGSLFRLLLVGSTERDHDFAAAVMRSLIGEPFELAVLTSASNRGTYAGLPNVRFLSGLNDGELRATYGDADLLLMPLLDCTANNALLESVACGTPILVNRVGGVPEYMSEECAWIMESLDVDAWHATLRSLAENRDMVEDRRPRVRAWSECFTWSRMASGFRQLYAGGSSVRSGG